MNKKYYVQLTESERAGLRSILNKGTHKSRTIKRARALLMCDEGYTNAATAEACDMTEITVSKLSQRFCAGGLQHALYDAARTGAPRKFNSEAATKIASIVSGEKPEGREKWTLRLLADRIVELEIAETVSPATVRRILSQTPPVKTEKKPAKSAKSTKTAKTAKTTKTTKKAQKK
jgi:hypothetical protein